MKIFTKTALACALAAGAVMAIAETVEIRDANNDLLVTYSSDSVVVEGGVITLKNANYENGLIPGIIPGTTGFSCGDNTQPHPDGLQVCIGTGGGANCGLGTELNQAGDQCVPATPPTLNITSNRSSLGDGVSNATLTFQFSRDVTGFSQGDIDVSPSSHTISGFTAVDGDTFRATLNRSGNSSGTINVSVDANSYQGTNGANGGGDSFSISLTGGTVNVGDCQVPSNVNLSNNIEVSSFGVPQGLIEFLMPRFPSVVSAGFNTTSGSIGGQVDLLGTTQTDLDIRRMWISECPGGEPVSPRCNSEGQLLSMRWKQGSSRTSCQLSTNRTYYFNLSSPGCKSSSGCGAYIQNLGGW